jgi:hypothetical protein
MLAQPFGDVILSAVYEEDQTEVKSLRIYKIQRRIRHNRFLFKALGALPHQTERKIHVRCLYDLHGRQTKATVTFAVNETSLSKAIYALST